MQQLGVVGLWGIAGVIAILAQALRRLIPMVAEVAKFTLTPLEIIVLIGWVAIMLYSEGWRGFHRQFSPRVVARAHYLSRHPKPLFALLAPIYCMGLIHATRKRLLVSWILTLAIVMLVIAVKQLAQPWRGIVDAGVVAGLAFGVGSIVYFTVNALRGRLPSVPPDVPEPSPT